MIRNNITLFSIILYLGLFLLINYMKPNIMYNPDGSIRNFGIGSKQKTVLPIWLITIFIAILSYFFILYFLVHNQIKF